MAPKKRLKKNEGYPRGWRWKNGAWRYRVPKGLEARWDGRREFTLGKTDSEAYKAWSDRLQLQTQVATVGDLLERYEFQVVPEKAKKTQQDNRTSIRRLRAVFGHMAITKTGGDLEPVHVYQYLDLRRDTPTSANRDVEVLSHAFSMAIRWGITTEHPIKGKVQAHSEKPRERYVEDWELVEALKVAHPTIRAYIGLKMLTGLRRTDLLHLSMSDLQDDGIHVRPSKTRHTTNKRLIIERTEALDKAIHQAKAARPKDIAPWLFITREGKPYIDEDGKANAFDSLWQRFMAKALEKTKLQERFQERDLRAKTASDMPLKLATALLGHADSKITQRVYRRRATVVKPAK